MGKGEVAQYTSDLWRMIRERRKKRIRNGEIKAKENISDISKNNTSTKHKIKITSKYPNLSNKYFAQVKSKNF